MRKGEGAGEGKWIGSFLHRLTHSQEIEGMKKVAHLLEMEAQS